MFCDEICADICVPPSGQTVIGVETTPPLLFITLVYEHIATERTGVTLSCETLRVLSVNRQVSVCEALNCDDENHVMEVKFVIFYYIKNFKAQVSFM